jgi:hypothetical protein
MRSLFLGVCTRSEASAALAATLAVAFVGGAGGAILSPWITHHLSGRSRLAERRQEPYAHMLEAARELVSVTTRRITGAEAAQSNAVRAFDQATQSADS